MNPNAGEVNSRRRRAFLMAGECLVCSEYEGFGGDNLERRVEHVSASDYNSKIEEGTGSWRKEEIDFLVTPDIRFRQQRTKIRRGKSGRRRSGIDRLMRRECGCLGGDWRGRRDD
jgi:hypothetical protein